MKYCFVCPNLVLAGLVGVAFSLPVPVRASDPAAPLPPIGRGPYLQLATSDSICIVWRTDWRRIEPVVRFGLSPDRLEEAVQGGAITLKAGLGKTNETDPRVLGLRTTANKRLPRLRGAPGGTFQYEATLSGLKPATRYFYAIFDGDQRLTPVDESYRFDTYPLPGRGDRMRFWVVGDNGTGRAPEYEVCRAALAQAQKDGRPFDFVLHTGDIAYLAGTDQQFQTRFFQPLGFLLRNRVCWPTLSNHDGASAKSSTGDGPYFDAFVLPSRGEAGGSPSHLEAVYSFQHGRAHFVCLDSFHLSRKTNGAMAAWLKADLAQARSKGQTDWLFAFFHHTPYTKGSHDGSKEKEILEMRQWIMPILETGGVDVVFNGHSHTYERTMLMDGCYGTNQVSENFVLDDGDGDPDGTGPYRKSAGLNPHEGCVVCVSGHGGMTLGRVGTLPLANQVFTEYGSTLVDIEGDTLTATMINQQGEQRDRFQMVKRGKVTPVRVALPWQPKEWATNTAKAEEKKTDKKEGSTAPKTDTRTKWPDALAELPVQYRVLIPTNAEWRYLAGTHPSGTDWRWPVFDDRKWPIGRAAFGYKYTTNVLTRLDNMRSNYCVVYLRQEFTVDRPDRITELALMINYDDGFIAYLNGREVLRRHVGRSSGERAQKRESHEAVGYQYCVLNGADRWLCRGTNVLAIEGHNHALESSDFLLDPYLVSEE